MSQPIFQCCPMKKTKSKKKSNRMLPSVNEIRKVITAQKNKYNSPNTTDNERDDINDQMTDLLKEIRDIVKDELKNIGNLPKDQQKQMVNQVVGEYARDVGIPEVIINRSAPLPPPPPMINETPEEKEIRMERMRLAREKKQDEVANPIVHDQRGNIAREAMMAVKAKKKAMKEKKKNEERMREEAERMRVEEAERNAKNEIDEILDQDTIDALNDEYYANMGKDPEIIFDENSLTENLINNKPFDEMLIENEMSAPLTKNDKKELTDHLIRNQLENLMMSGEAEYIGPESYVEI